MILGYKVGYLIISVSIATGVEDMKAF